MLLLVLSFSLNLSSQPFTASQRSSNVPEPQPVASTNVPAVSTLEFPPHVMNGYDYRSAPGFFEFPNFQAYLKQFPVVYHQQQQQEDETQQTEQTPDNSGTKGGSGSTDGGTKGGTGTKGTPVRNGFFSRFWRYGRPVAKEDYVKPEVIEPVASADTTGTVVNVQDGDTVFVSEPMAVDPANVQFGNSGFLESAPNPKHPGKLMPWNWVFWNQEQQQGQQGPELLSAPVAPVPVVGVTHPVDVSVEILCLCLLLIHRYLFSLTGERTSASKMENFSIATISNAELQYAEL